MLSLRAGLDCLRPSHGYHRPFRWIPRSCMLCTGLPSELPGLLSGRLKHVPKTHCPTVLSMWSVCLLQARLECTGATPPDAMIGLTVIDFWTSSLCRQARTKSSFDFNLSLLVENESMLATQVNSRNTSAHSIQAKETETSGYKTLRERAIKKKNLPKNDQVELPPRHADLGASCVTEKKCYCEARGGPNEVCDEYVVDSTRIQVEAKWHRTLCSQFEGRESGRTATA